MTTSKETLAVMVVHVTMQLVVRAENLVAVLLGALPLTVATVSAANVLAQWLTKDKENGQ